MVKNNKTTLYTLSVTVLLVFVWLLIWPNVTVINSLNEQINNEKADVLVLEETQTSILEARAFFSKLTDEDRELVELAVPKFPDKANLVSVLNNLAEQNGLVVDSISAKEDEFTDKKKSVGFFGTMSTTLVLEGNYLSLKEFINSLERSLRIFEVDKIDIKPADNNLEVFTINVRAFYAR